MRELGLRGVLLVGDYTTNSGPSNVTKALIDNGKFDYVRSTKKLHKIAELLLRFMKNDVIVLSGAHAHAKILIRLVKFFKKRCIYLMHGCLEYENDINNLNLHRTVIENEVYILENIDRIVCVSEKYREWVVKRYPSLSRKCFFINNGISEIRISSKEGIEHQDAKVLRVVLFGADRKMKCNEQVCEALEKVIVKENIECCVEIFGRDYGNINIFSRFPFVSYRGHTTKRVFHEALKRANMFVLNSTVESFGLSVFDALECGSSILLAKNTGALSVIRAKEEDIIFDNYNTDEIANKIINLLWHPNARRLIETIDFERCSWKQSAEDLYMHCETAYDE